MNQSTSLHTFDQSIALEADGDNAWRGRFPAAYANMVGPYGGIIAATLLNAVLRHPGRLGDPVAMTVNFAGPIGEADFDVSTRIARTNRSTQHWILELSQDDQIAVTATVLTGVRRDSWESADVSMPEVPPAGSVEPLDARGYLRWIQNYELRIVDGAFDPSGRTPAQENAVTRLWVRDHPARPLDFLSLMAASDCFFPRVFVRRQERMPAGTVSLTTYFHADAATLARQGDRSLLGQARANRYSRSYFDQSAELWSADGELLATSHQIVYFKG
ncbi:acyl-CoA thioesterase [Marinobacter bohaiensis]|uniref:acyl-CoA thioesterase n=1 Tax=Marinobacter bohaiensis TaxID=2201898 RepID=UPI000DABAB66|nr:thioesterase family protein [Marinobacter bohaiensis]